MEEKNYWLGFSAFSGVGPVRFKKLLTHFGSAKNAWKAAPQELIDVGFSEALVSDFEKFRSVFSLRQYIKNLNLRKIHFLTLIDPDYPALLKQSKRAPFVLYCKGEGEKVKGREGVSILNSKNIISIVGTRRITQYGREVTRLFTEELAAAGLTIVSGLALGVDALAHQTAIETNGKTVAVLGSGVDLCYPGTNRNLYNQIIQTGGAIVSEFPLGQLPTKGSFPSRNRIIAGLSLAVLVTEGAEDSGALITADYALSYGRRVFAVPGPITSNLSKGPYKLIEKGAKLVTSAQAILNELNIKGDKGIKGITPLRQGFAGQEGIKGDNKDEEAILKILENEAMDFDQIKRLIKYDTAKLSSLLSFMEIKGMIKSLDNGMFSVKT